MAKQLSNWGCEGEWQEAEDTTYTGYDERCNDCVKGTTHSWNAHYRLVNEQRSKI